MKNINKCYSINGTYGSGHTEDTIHVCQDNRGVNWYCVDGSVNVNATIEDLYNGVHVEDLTDFDGFTTSNPVTDLAVLDGHVSGWVDYLEEAQGY